MLLEEGGEIGPPVHGDGMKFKIVDRFCSGCHRAFYSSMRDYRQRGKSWQAGWPGNDWLG